MSNPQYIANKIVARNKGFGRGYVFNSADFRDMGSLSALDQALFRLTRQGVIRRLAPGESGFPCNY